MSASYVQGIAFHPLSSAVISIRESERVRGRKEGRRERVCVCVRVSLLELSYNESVSRLFYFLHRKQGMGWRGANHTQDSGRRESEASWQIIQTTVAGERKASHQNCPFERRSRGKCFHEIVHAMALSLPVFLAPGSSRLDSTRLASKTPLSPDAGSHFASESQ